jgi:hypothetical protein
VTVHFIHIGKTGGTAIKWALRQGENKPPPMSPYGEVLLHRHMFRLVDAEPDDQVFFCVRDPLTRFLSGFYSRLRKGRPRYVIEWTEDERHWFELFPTPQRLAAALSSKNTDERAAAELAMRQIRHLRPLKRWLKDPGYLAERLPQVLYIGRQETLDADWEQIKDILDLPGELSLPADPVSAHRHDPDEDWDLDVAARTALQKWYAMDMRLVELCEKVRIQRGWGTMPTSVQ